jgi:hypothetical protein
MKNTPENKELARFIVALVITFVVAICYHFLTAH